MSSQAIASPNIALIKYWGKIAQERQDDLNIGLNPSLSMTLSNAQTHCEVSLHEASPTEIFINDLKANERDFLKVSEHVSRVCKYFSKNFPHVTVRTRNNFPQGVGIASSASAFAALTLATVAELFGKKEAQSYLTHPEKNHILSRLARMGSGSASRSVSGGYMYWDGPFAVPYQSSMKLFDTIVIFSREHKKVSSREGHDLATSSPLFPARLTRLPERLSKAQDALTMQNLAQLGQIIEVEALELHQIAESSVPPINYVLPETQLFLTALKNLPKRDFYFTMDAGPNVHILSKRPVREELEKILKDLGLKVELWEDWTGSGPMLV